ncbi:MAG: phosphoribosylpyrophosphate synthetase [Flavobacterium sp.]|nr:phosphoribosylpyrophosphate synthetase [Flavobacterium sp.]
MRNFDSLIDAINQLKIDGYTEDFNLKSSHLACSSVQNKIFHDEFVIDEYYRFEDDTSADEQAIIYAISSDKYKLKGILINGYSIYSESISDEMMTKLKNR